MGLVELTRMRMIWIYDALMHCTMERTHGLYMRISTIASSPPLAETSSCMSG